MTVLANYYGYKFAPPFGRLTALLFSKLYADRIATAHIPKYVEHGKLLDIGCSYGAYISKMADYGWEVHGIEINNKATEYAKNVLGLKNIFNGFFEQYPGRENYFDVIHMSMALEHLHEPVQCLNRIYEFLKKGGQLIVSVPDISGFEAKLYGKYAYTLQVPQHLNHFTPTTITKMLQKCGFTVEKIVHQSAAKDLIESANYLKNKTLYKILSMKVLKRIIIKPMMFLLAKVGKTSRMSVYARK